ncbi:MAG: LamG domain-containing protein, partial [Muribaculaceae bacterium]|nr:LamG domain-containing protein [Muribaculaceae bacterium]
VTMPEVQGSDILESSRTVFYRISRVFEFTSLHISNTSLYSNFIFDDNQAIELGAFTYEIKCYSEAWHSIARLCSFTGKAEQRSSMLRFGEGGYPVNSLQWVAAPADGGNMVSNTLFAENRWYMISLVYDGKRCTMYVDGVKDVEKDADGEPVTFQRFELGMSWAGYPASQWFRGRVAEVRVWDFARSAADIANTICSVDPNSEGLRAYWKMNEGEGSIFHDATGNGYDMDWKNTVRCLTESTSEEPTPDAYKAIAWDSDEKNKCAQ